MEKKGLFKGNPNPDSSTITNRGYIEVCESLHLPVHGLKPGQVVISIGEGLSDFARTLHATTGADVLAIDAIYSVVHPTDSVETATQKMQASGIGWFNWLSLNPAKPWPAGESPVAIAASAYELPLADASIDLVVSNRLLEHVDMAKAIPEMVRVMKETGEVRVGSPMLIFEEQGQYELFPGLIDDDGFGHHYPQAYHGLKGLQEYLTQHPELQVYVFSSCVGHQRGFDYLLGDVLIIRRDKTLPDIFINEQDPVRPHAADFARLFQVIGTSGVKFTLKELS